MKKKTLNASHEEMPGDVSKLKGWTKARQVLDSATTKLPARRITINIDSDIIAIFKAEALRGGLPYQVAINQALRRYLHDRETPTGDRTVRAILTALDDRAVRRKVQSISRSAK